MRGLPHRRYQPRDSLRLLVITVLAVALLCLAVAAMRLHLSPRGTILPGEISPTLGRLAPDPPHDGARFVMLDEILRYPLPPSLPIR